MFKACAMQYLKLFLALTVGLAIGFAVAVLMVEFLAGQPDRKEPVLLPTLPKSLSARPVPMPRKPD